MNKIKIIWVEPLHATFQSFKRRADARGIELTPVVTFSEAIRAVNDDQRHWDAVLLNPTAPHDALNPMPPLSGMIGLITQLNMLKARRLIHFYIFSTAADYNANRATIDLYDHHNVYLIGQDNSRLIEALVALKQNSQRLALQNRYADVFRALSQLQTDPEAADIILSILLPLHHQDENVHFEPWGKYNQLRKVIEHIFRALNRHGLLPDEFFNPRTGVNLSASSHYLAGNEVKMYSMRYGSSLSDHILPRRLADMLKYLLLITNKESHTDAAQNDTWHPSSSGYLLYSCLLELFEVILFLASFLATHPDAEANRAMKKTMQEIVEEDITVKL